MTKIRQVLETLGGSGVEFILIGGVAATIHGSSRFTRDVDVVYRRTPDNVSKLVAALGASSPYLRGAPPGLPFRFDEKTISSGLNFTLTTKLGDVDLLGEVIGGGGYDELLAHSEVVEAYGLRIRCVDLPTLIHLKRAAGRPRDLDAIAELEHLRAQRAPRQT